MIRKFLLLAVGAVALAASVNANAAETIRIAEHRQARIDALKSVVPDIEKKYGVKIEIVEYPAPEKDYFSKILTELKSGNAPDIFTAPRDQDVPDLAGAGYIAPVTDEVMAWNGYDQVFNVVKTLAMSADGKIYVLPATISVEQIYYRKDILDKAGISTAQPKDWPDLLARAKEIKQKTGAYGLMLPAGVTWGGGAFGEGFRYMITGTPTPQLVNDDGTLNLTSAGVRDVFGFYADLINNDLMPIDPLLGPEPWVIPKYEMFPAGKLVATTCGTWCYIYDWGPKSKNPIPDVTKKVGTWLLPAQTGGAGHVMVGLNSPWVANAKAADLAMTKKVMLELGSVKADVAYARQLGNLPARKDVAGDADFQKITELVPVLQGVENGTFLKSAAGFSAVSEGIARATEVLLRKKTDAAGAQKILVDYVKGILGDEAVR